MQAKKLFERLSSVTEKHLDTQLSYLGAVPQDQYLKRAVQEQRPVLSAYPRSPSSLAIQDVAKKVLTSGHIHSTSGGLTFFFEQLLDIPADQV